MNSTKDEIVRLVDELPQERLVQLLQFAVELDAQEELAEWQRFGQQRMAAAYSDEEPEYGVEVIIKDN